MRRRVVVSVAVLLVLLYSQLTVGIRWMALHHAQTNVWNGSKYNLPAAMSLHTLGGGGGMGRRASKVSFGLTKRQEQLVRDTPGLLPLLNKAALSALTACQAAFADHRWNCSSLALAPYLSPDLTQGTREQAFVYALSSATVAHVVARACAGSGAFDCTCADTPRDPPDGNFKWGGCGDNVMHGIAISRRFVDVVERGRGRRKLNKTDRVRDEDETDDEVYYNELPPHRKTTRANSNITRAPGINKKKALLAQVNLHNNRAGRRALELSLAPQCKCHGVSGACNIKTCWKALARVQDVAERLKRRYNTATEVTLRRRGVAGRRHLQPARLPLATPPTLGTRGATQYGKNDLLYATKSPDYCSPDKKFGSFGTRGRMCNASEEASPGLYACSSMCCGRGHVTRSEERIERCHCKYKWCCFVDCKNCKRIVKASYCL